MMGESWWESFSLTWSWRRMFDLVMFTLCLRWPVWAAVIHISELENTISLNVILGVLEMWSTRSANCPQCTPLICSPIKLTNLYVDVLNSTNRLLNTLTKAWFSRIPLGNLQPINWNKTDVGLQGELCFPFLYLLFCWTFADLLHQPAWSHQAIF